jgi:hypothetical protein
MNEIKRDYQKDNLDIDSRNDELALNLAIVVEEIRKMNGSSFIEPCYKQAAGIYEELYLAIWQNPITDTISIRLPRRI